MRDISRIFVLVALSGVLTVLFVPPARALSLKSTTQEITKPVKTLLETLNKKQPKSNNPSGSQSSTNSSSTQNSQEASKNSSPEPSNKQTDTQPTENTKTAPVFTAGMLKETGSLNKLEDSQVGIPLGSVASAQFASSQKIPAITASTQSVGILNATENGWQLFGVLWYWWVGCVGVAAGLILWREPLQKVLARYRQQ